MSKNLIEVKQIIIDQKEGIYATGFLAGILYMPKIAASRGNMDDRKTDIYTSMESKYSQIHQEGQQLIIQLDKDYFQQPSRCKIYRG